MNPSAGAARRLLTRLAEEAVAAAKPERQLADFLPGPPAGTTLVVGAGKAAAGMAEVVEQTLRGPFEGLIVTSDGTFADCKKLELLQAGHPVPDARGLAAAERILGRVQGLGEKDLLLCLISGGGSALLPLPVAGVSLADKQKLTRQLLACGADIHEINSVRKHLSRIKGGRLAAAAAPARVVSLLVSDVSGDDISVIASGPTAPDASTLAEARAVLARYQLEAEGGILAALNDASNETPKPGSGVFQRVSNHLVLSAMRSLKAAARLAETWGIKPLILGDGLTGEAREAGRVQAGIAKSCADQGQPAKGEAVLILSGGEHTVRISGAGRGGPNGEFLLGMAEALAGHPKIHALAMDTDGLDGSGRNAGAFLYPDTLARAAAVGRKADAALAENDSLGFFAALDDLYVTGPTGTNVNDFRALLIADGPWLQNWAERQAAPSVT